MEGNQLWYYVQYSVRVVPVTQLPQGHWREGWRERERGQWKSFSYLERVYGESRAERRDVPAVKEDWVVQYSTVQ